MQKKISQQILILAILFCFLSQSMSGQQLFINEILSSNDKNITDNDGDNPDWLEIYNPQESAVNLEGFGLSDDDDEPMKWKFPNIYIPARGYLLVFASDKNRKTFSPYRETIINWQDQWKYQPGNEEIPNHWNTLNFDDSLWLAGKSGFGFGDNDDNTIIDQTISLYIRKTFDLENVADVKKIYLHVDYDDGFIAYLNGQEVARANMGNPGTTATYNQPATGSHEAAIVNGGQPELFEITGFIDALHSGENLIALQVHNQNENSPDMTLIPFLTLERSVPPQTSKGVAEILGFETQYLHTNFKISKDGEILTLADKTGNVIDLLDKQELPKDISWGRYPDGSSNFYLFDEPTPGQSNSSAGFINVAEKPNFNYSAGFYATPINLMMTTGNSDFNIYYTLDGSEPTTDSRQYTVPITIDKTTVVKARAFNRESLTSEINTQTYFINETTSLAVISLSTNPANLWDDETGIYVEGTKGIPGYCSEEPKNWNQDWERQGYIEFFEPNKTPGFDINCGIKIGGACTRKYPQKTLAIYTRSEFGDRKIHYKIFPEKDIDEYNNINIRNGGQDWWRALFRDGVMQTIVANQMNIDYDAYRPMILFINGEYWGIHGLREKHNEHYIAGNHNLDPDEIDMVKGNSELVQGSAQHYKNMLAFIQDNDLSLAENYQYIQTQMDVDEYIDYQIAEIFFANIDWPGGNIKYWRPQTTEGKWRWIFYDTDLGFGAHDKGQYYSNSLTNATAPQSTYYANPAWSTFLFRNLLKNETFCDEFTQRYCVHISTTFERNRVVTILDSLKSLVVDEIPRHQNKWPQSTSFAPSWQDHIDIMEEFAIMRPKAAREHLAEKFNLNHSSTITLVTEPHKGEVKVNGVKILQPVTNLRLFDGIATRFEAKALAGNSFSGWSGLIESDTDSISLVFSENDTLFANFSTTNIENTPTVKSRILLKKNYPNPFNPTTTIEYEISKTAFVTLSIYDNTGALVKKLIQKTQQSGKYSIKWHAENQPSGIYFYHLKVGNFTQTRKCLLIK